MRKKIPLQVNLEASSVCNLRCKYCPAWTGHANARLMEPDLFISIIDRVVAEGFDTTIVPYLNGEALLHPKYYELIKYVVDRNLRVYFTTNGTIWNERLFQLITQPNSVYEIIFSVDGLWDYKSRSIELARPGSRRDLIRQNIQKFIYLNNSRNNGKNLDTCVKICHRGQDFEEIENYISYWLEYGIDFVCVGQTLLHLNEKSMRIYPCQYSDSNFMVIKSDGRVVLCPYNDDATNNPDFAMGSVLNDTPLLDIFNNEKFMEYREDQQNGIFHPPCDTCSFAYTGTGYRGEVKFRNPALTQKKIYFSQDFYNSFYSYKEQAKPNSYYGYKE